MLLTSASRRRSHVRRDIATLPPVNGRAHMSEAHTPTLTLSALLLALPARPCPSLYRVCGSYRP